MSMKDFYCDMLELSFRLTPEEIDQDKFLKAVGIENREETADADGDIIISKTFGPRESTTDYHGHMTVLLDKEGKGRLDLRYHEGAEGIEDEEPPSIEDCAHWLADFLRKEEITTRISASYLFDGSYAPTITLPFPLATSEKGLERSSVIGVSLQFPKEDELDLAVVQRGKDETFVSILTTTKIRVRAFDLFTELKRLDGSLNSLVRKRESSHETGNVGKEE